ncbi:MAG: Diguanylate cyclase DosC [Anaerolineales bacterium]|nr:Diguanylate cyclase DosC [Anaerolineales bacterium]
MKIVLIGSDRIWLARIRDALTTAGHRVEIGHDVSDAGLLVRSISAEMLLVDVGAGEDLSDDLPRLQELMASHSDLDVMAVLAPMQPFEEDPVVKAMQSAGIHLHLPRRFVASPHFDTVLTLMGDYRRLRQVHEQQGAESTEPSAEPGEPQEDVELPDFTYLKEVLSQELREGTELSLMMVSIDNLEAIQSKGGHEAAEQALQDLASLLRADLRDTDIVAHTRNDEQLAVLLLLTDAVHAKRVASRVQIKQARRSLGAVSITAGIAEADEAMDADTLIRHAESAWNKAKRRDDRLAVLSGTSPGPA